MKEKNKKILEAGSVMSCIIVGFVCALMIMTTTTQPLIENQLPPVGHQKSWHYDVLGDITPGAGASGIVNISICKHNVFTYTANITRNASMYVWSETNNTQAGTGSAGGTAASVPYTKRLDVVVKVRWNKTHAYNSTSKVWNVLPAWAGGTTAWTRMNCTMPQFGLENASMVPYNITGQGLSSSNLYLYVQYTFNASASGFWINKSQRIRTCYVRGWAYY